MNRFPGMEIVRLVRNQLHIAISTEWNSFCPLWCRAWHQNQSNPGIRMDTYFRDGSTSLGLGLGLQHFLKTTQI